MSSDTPFIDTARDVIRAEADALGTLADSLNSSFREAVDLLLNAHGRVIVTGIGKSGHIARKVAATLASTGTPAQFGGEAPELANMIAFSRRCDIPLLGITKAPNSSLGSQCDVVLQLPDLGEACGTGVVPTISTTMTLALGDALAVALMKHRAFTAEHFREFHPGGKLGAQLSRVSDLMHAGAAMPLVTRGCDDHLPYNDTNRVTGRRSRRPHEPTQDHLRFCRVPGRTSRTTRYPAHPRLPAGGTGLRNMAWTAIRDWSPGSRCCCR